MQDLREALSTHFGYGGFRPGQEAIIRSVLSGRPTLAILPTGGGKSLCYQLPALLLEGTTVVASPLVALMKDQVDALSARGIPATFVNSSLSEADRRERQARIRAGDYRLVYVAPERFRSGSFREAIAQVRVPLFAIDEAHCISSWGHDFRPDYLRLAEAWGHLRAERILALTATATPEVRKDVVRALGLEDPQVFVAGFDRPNLFVEVARASGDQEKVGRILSLARRKGPGLVYAATRRNVEKVVLALRANGIDAVGYHAGMDDAERSAAQERFLRGEVSVVVATNAFGMGVDKANIRFVVHFHVPRSIEAYYQEIGRAGRDGAGSLALLLFNYADVMLQKRMIEGARPKEETVRKVWDAARTLGSGGAAELAAVCGVHPADAQAALKLLEVAGHLARRGQDFSVLTPEVEEPAVDFEMAALRVAHERRYGRVPASQPAPVLRRSRRAALLPGLRPLRRAARSRRGGGLPGAPANAAALATFGSGARRHGRGGLRRAAGPAHPDRPRDARSSLRRLPRFHAARARQRAAPGRARFPRREGRRSEPLATLR